MRVLPDVLTIWASPSLADDPARPDLGPVAVLTLVPHVTVHTADDCAGAEPIDLMVSELLARASAWSPGWNPPI